MNPYYYFYAVFRTIVSSFVSSFKVSFFWFESSSQSKNLGLIAKEEYQKNINRNIPRKYSTNLVLDDVC